MQYCVEDGVDRIMIMLMMTLDGLVVEKGGVPGVPNYSAVPF